jgi:hypothetical protein
MLIVGLLAAVSVANDRIAFAKRASPQDDLVAIFGPVGFQLVRRDGKWDKENRSPSGLCSGIDLAKDLSRERSPFLLKKNSNWKRITLLGFSFYGWVIQKIGRLSDTVVEIILWLLKSPHLKCHDVTAAGAATARWRTR